MSEQEWQPIETAPKDGTNVMVWADGYEWPEIIRYEEYPEDVAQEVGEPGFWRYSDDLFADIARGIEFETFIAWMPLPSPPPGRMKHERATGNW